MNTPAEIFERAAQRRLRVADFADALTPEQLAVPSLCPGWDVRTTLGHLVTQLLYGRADIVVETLRHGGSFHRANDALARRVATRPIAELSSALRQHAASRFTPPIHGPAAPLNDLCVHGADMRVPLGMGHDITAEEAAVGLDMLARATTFMIPRRRLRGIALVADDLDRRWGRGSELRGNAAELLLVAFGRASFLDAVRGPGRDALAGRP